MNSAFIHAAVFGIGAAVGIGAATAVHRRTVTPVPVLEPPAPTPPLQSTPSLKVERQQHIVSNNISDVLRFGPPGPISDLLLRKAYAVGYDRRLRHPAWTAEHLTPESLGRNGPKGAPKGDRGNSVFTEDESIPSQFRAKLSDYFRSGYDRGHMVPAADAKSSQEAMNETFLLTNIAPQVGVGFNRHYWAYVEDWCRRLTGTFPDVYVFTIPLYLPKQTSEGKWRVSYEVIGSPPNVAVPTHFAKVILASKPTPSSSNPLSRSLGTTSQGSEILELSIGAFVIPNAIIPDDVPLESFSVPVDSVERAAGLTLFADSVKSKAKHICKTASCQLVIRRFDDAVENSTGGKGGPKAIAPPRS